MGISVIVRFHAKPGATQSLLDTLLAVVKPTRAEPGCVQIQLYRAIKDPQVFFIHSTWTHESDFDSHADLPHTQLFLSRLPDLIDHPLDATRVVPAG
jgi:quinol monooxygenase YgiN